MWCLDRFSPAAGLNVSVNASLSLEWRPVQGVLRLLPYDHWDGLHPTLNWVSGKKWMDEWTKTIRSPNL